MHVSKNKYIQNKKRSSKIYFLANLLRGRIKHYPLNISYIFLQNSSSQEDKQSLNIAMPIWPTLKMRLISCKCYYVHVLYTKSILDINVLTNDLLMNGWTNPQNIETVIEKRTFHCSYFKLCCEHMSFLVCLPHKLLNLPSF